jgi:hypothetical protein
MKPQITALSGALLTFIFLTQASVLSAQQTYDDAEGSKIIHYSMNRGARIDSAAANPAPDDVNPSAKCIQYTRSMIKYDCLRLNPQGRISDVSTFASYEQGAPRLKMKLYTTAPIGTLIEIQLQRPSDKPYPEGVQSQYQARTTVSKAWEELEFVYSQSPAGSNTQPNEVEFITILVNPNSLTRDIYYFDDIVGPAIVKDEVSQRSKKRR